MFEIGIQNTIIFAISFLGVFYIIASALHGKVIKTQFKKLFWYVTIYSLLGVVGEVFVNTLYADLFNTPLWEYRLFPAHNGSISYFFPFVWGSLGFYKYITDYLFAHKRTASELHTGFVTGAEAIYLELLYNGLYFSTFGNYIFYYFPKNLGPFSHFSCLQVIPFYFLVGLLGHTLVKGMPQTKSAPLFCFYWLIIVTLVWFT